MIPCIQVACWKNYMFALFMVFFFFFSKIAEKYLLSGVNIGADFAKQPHVVGVWKWIKRWWISGTSSWTFPSFCSMHQKIVCFECFERGNFWLLSAHLCKLCPNPCHDMCVFQAVSFAFCRCEQFVSSLKSLSSIRSAFLCAFCVCDAPTNLCC